VKINSAFLKDTLLPILFLLVGLYAMPLRIMDGFNYIPGDFGDARFNMYILEHGHNFLRGEVDSFWDADFLYPSESVVAFSDNLLGTMPVYSLFRLLTFDNYTSFQLWILSLFALNYFLCFLALKKWFSNSIVAIIGSYIFAFGIFNIGQIYHVQVFPRFMIPITLYWFWKYLNDQKIRTITLTSLGVAYQFYCGIYLGFFLIYGLIFSLVAYLIVYNKGFIKRLFNKHSIFHLFLSISILFICLYPLFYNYLKVAKEFGLREFENIYATIPFISSYFFSSPTSIPWGGMLYAHSAYQYDQWWLHLLFPGITPWLSFLIFPIILYKDKPSIKKLGLFLFCLLVLSFAFSLRNNDFSLFKWIYKIPGFSSMRAIVRIVNVQVFILILFLSYCLNRLSVLYPKTKVLMIFFLAFVLFDNSFRVDEGVKRYNKEESIAQVEHFKESINKHDFSNYEAIAVGLPDEVKHDHAKVIVYHVGIMLASQELGVKCVNGYTGNYPDNYMQFFDYSNQETLHNYISQSTDKSIDNILFIQLDN